jgi:hypothetical protein
VVGWPLRIGPNLGPNGLGYCPEGGPFVKVTVVARPEAVFRVELTENSDKDSFACTIIRLQVPR